MDAPIIGDNMTEEKELEFLEYLAGIDPTSPALLKLAGHYRALGQPWRALEISERILAAHPGRLDAAIFAANVMLEQKNKDEARDILNRFLDLDLLGEQLSQASSLLLKLDDYRDSARAGRAADSLLQRDNESTVDIKEARAETELIDPEAEPVPTETLASLYLAQGHREMALDVYERLAELHPDNPVYAEKAAELGTREQEELEPAALPEDVDDDAVLDDFASPDVDSIIEEMEPPDVPDAVEKIVETAEHVLDGLNAEDPTLDLFDDDSAILDELPADEDEIIAPSPEIERKKRLAERLMRIQAAARRRRESIEGEPIQP